jgi:DNA repair exonuclease SbcCD ATPase subunit
MIVFRSVKWKNFLSTGNSFTEVQLDRSPNTLIVGNNGAGKSTILDALTFGLFGKPFRNISKKQLVNSINGRSAVVEVEFDIGKKSYRIVRSIKPTKFEIYLDGQMLDQKAALRDMQEMLEKNILKLNYKSFTQVVILGSATFTPFMQLSASNRREVIENLLDIEIFSVMNTLLKQRTSTNKQDLLECNNKLELTKEKIQLQKDYINTLRTDNEAKISTNNEAIDQSKKGIETHKSTIERIQADLGELLEKSVGGESFRKKLSSVLDMQSKLNRTIQKHEGEIAFYEENDNCPTCQQEIDEALKANKRTALKAKIDTVQNAIPELEQKQIELKEQISAIELIEKQISQLRTDIHVEETSISSLEKYIEKIQSDTDNLKDETQIDGSAQKKLDKLGEALEILSNAKEKLINDKHLFDVAAILLKDSGIKTKIIRQYLPIINKLVNKYLSSMDFFVQFELDENFNETIKSRHRDEFSYASFSEGEKMRIDLALLFTWRAIAKMKNSVNTNLLMLDEVFDSSLDGTGTDEFLKIMDTLGKDTNIFVISHKGDQLFDKFYSVIRFEKHKDYSRIAGV